MSSVQALTQLLLDFVQPISLSPFNIGVQITAVALPCLLLSETAHSTLGRWIFKPLASLGFLVAALSYIPNNATSFVASSTAVATSHSTLAEIPGAITNIGALELSTAYASELKHILFNVAPTLFSSSSAATAAAGPVVVHTTYTQAMMLAFVLGWIGDVLLIPVRGFLPGLVSFLAGHAAFMVAFTFHGQDVVARKKGLRFIITMAVIVGRWLLPKIRNKIMRGAVVAYMFVISVMVLTAFGSITLEQDFIPERIVGALMFFFSDLFVARQQFVHKSILNKWIGLPLYYGAQILLASTLRGEHVLH
ncbi:hypothetical protein BGZ65_012801 [Modicella reniformis]|uniref:YhhN-domain-containing protein n=1 Tax=Modicella reniformis TaxID=1440133 RepID=A0A9P6J9Q9_9FUNG|nr:hypothetical protein BGZ65_012801 [Modicella reniformis]